MAIQRVYSDIDLNFQPHPITGDVVKVFDENAIKQSVLTLIMTNFYERPMQPYLGSNVRDYLFENASPAVADALRRDVRDVIEKHEPRAKIVSIDVTYDEGAAAYSITVVVVALGLDKPVTINVLLERVR